MDENALLLFIQKAYNPELLHDGIIVLRDAKLLTKENLNIILSKTESWDTARTIVYLHQKQQPQYLKLALEDYPHFYRAQIIIALLEAKLKLNYLESVKKGKTKDYTRLILILILSKNSLLNEANLELVLNNQVILFSPKINLLWERFCMSMETTYEHRLTTKQF